MFKTDSIVSFSFASTYTSVVFVRKTTANYLDFVQQILGLTLRVNPWLWNWVQDDTYTTKQFKPCLHGQLWLVIDNCLAFHLTQMNTFVWLFYVGPGWGTGPSVLIRNKKIAITPPHPHHDLMLIIIADLIDFDKQSASSCSISFCAVVKERRQPPVTSIKQQQQQQHRWK